MESEFEKLLDITQETTKVQILRLLKVNGFFLPQTFEEKAKELAEYKYFTVTGHFTELKFKEEVLRQARDFLKQKYGEK